MGSEPDVRSYSGYIVDGVRFHIVEHDSRRTTQNSGVMVVGGENNNFYGVLDKVLNVHYLIGRRVWLFKCM